MRSSLLPFALLIVVTGVLYLPTVTYPAVYEDLNDPDTFFAAPSLSAYVDRLLHRPTRIATELSFAANRVLFGSDSMVGYHAGSVALHLLNVALLAVVAWQAFAPATALVVAIIFAFHPLNVEAVAYVSSRDDLVSASGVLLALWAASRGAFAGALGGVLLACLGKETAIVAWGLVPLWATWTGAPFPVRKWLICSLVLVPISAFVIWKLRLHVGPSLVEMATTNASIWRLLALFPVPIGLTIDHDWQGLSALTLRICALLTVAATCYATLAWRSSWWALAWLWTLVSLAPRFVVQTHEGLHEHHFSVVLVGLSLCAGAWITSTRIEPRAVRN